MLIRRLLISVKNMKFKNVIISLGLAAVMGVGVAAGLSGKEAKAAKAYTVTNRTVYCAIDTTTLGSYTLKLNCNVGDGNTWIQSNMTDLNDLSSYPGKKVFSGIVEERYGGVDAMQFQLYDGSTWKAQDQVISSWTTYDNYTDKLHVYGGAANSWTTYAPPGVSQYSVTYHLDDLGTPSSDTVVVNEGSLPSHRALAYGEVFSGWYSNSGYTGDPLTGITANGDVYGKIELAPTKTYSYDVSRVSAFTSVYLHAWDDNGNNGGWPGIQLNTTSFTIPSTASFVLHNNDGTQTVDVTQSGVANDTVRVLNTKTGEKQNYVWTSTLDEPAEDGYYIVGLGGWDYAHATKMTFNNDYSALDTNGNIAVYYGLHLAKDDEIKVRSFINEVDTFYGFENTGSNYVCPATGDYDIFYKNNQFFVAEHAERYTVSIYNVLYEGATKISSTAGTSQLATEGQTFTPAEEAQSGYRYFGAYTDSNCTTAYTPAILDSDTTLYLKYEKTGYYVVGGTIGWGVDTGLYAAGSGSNHAVYEGLTVAANETVKFFRYDAAGDGAWFGHSALGADYSEIIDSDLDNNIVFKAAGTYSLYLNDSDEIYIEFGLNSYMTTFLAKVQSKCDANGVNTDTAGLATVWGELATAYGYLSDADQLALKNATADSASADNKEVVAAAYDYIYAKYGTSLSLANFMNRSVSPAPASLISLNGFNTISVIALVASALLLVSLAGFVIIRKKKAHN